jgi:hypothetical protein
MSTFKSAHNFCRAPRRKKKSTKRVRNQVRNRPKEEIQSSYAQKLPLEIIMKLQ